MAPYSNPSSLYSIIFNEKATKINFISSVFQYQFQCDPSSVSFLYFHFLKRTYKKKANKEGDIEEKPWISNDIRKEIKKRKALNRMKRNAKSEEEKKELNDKWNGKIKRREHRQ